MIYQSNVWKMFPTLFYVLDGFVWFIWGEINNYSNEKNKYYMRGIQLLDLI